MKLSMIISETLEVTHYIEMCVKLYNFCSYIITLHYILDWNGISHALHVALRLCTFSGDVKCVCHNVT